MDITQAELIKALQAENNLDDLDELDKAVFQLGEMGAKIATPQLIELLKNTDSNTTHTVIEALGKIKATESIPYLIHILQNDGSKSSREFAAQALGEIGTIEALFGLVNALKEENSFLVKKAIVIAVEEIEEQLSRKKQTSLKEDFRNNNIAYIEDYRIKDEYPSYITTLRTLPRRSVSSDHKSSIIKRAKDIQLISKTKNYHIKFWIELIKNVKYTGDKIDIRVLVLPEKSSEYLEKGFSLEVLNEDKDSVFNEDGVILKERAEEPEEFMKLDFYGESDDCFFIKLSLEDAIYEEKFII